MRIFGASALLLLGLSACGGPANTPDAVSSQAPETTTAAPTPTEASVKKYTSEELAALVGQMQDAQGLKLSVMSSADLSGSLDQTKALLSSMTVEPAECQELAIAGTAPSAAGTSAAIGASLDATVGASTAVSLTSGLDPTFLEQGVAQTRQLTKCENISMSTENVKIAVTLTLLDGLGSVPETVAYRTDTTMPDGRKQSMITAQLVQRGVLITVMASGGKSEEDAVSRAGALMGQAATLIK